MIECDFCFRPAHGWFRIGCKHEHVDELPLCLDHVDMRLFCVPCLTPGPDHHECELAVVETTRD
jgi:hypothetical protein